MKNENEETKRSQRTDFLPSGGASCSVAYLEGALARAKTWSIHNSSYPSHTDEHKEWLRGYADYPLKFSSANVQEHPTDEAK